ncbi:hypothetical protein HN51_040772 [Arachis hypogaea]
MIAESGMRRSVARHGGAAWTHRWLLFRPGGGDASSTPSDEKDSRGNINLYDGVLAGGRSNSGCAGGRRRWLRGDLSTRLMGMRHWKRIWGLGECVHGNNKRQPYRFKSTLTVLNNGLNDLKSWKVFVKFQHNEFLVFASGVVLAVGTTLPATIGNGTIFAGYPMTDLKIAVETTSDLTQMQDQIDLVGTVFGMAPPTIPLPSSINVANDGFIWKNVSNVCCTRDPKFKTNIIIDDEFLRHHDGDLSIMYDAIGAYDSNYWAEVTIANHNPLGRLDNWKLSWDWMNDEFIYSINGAYLYVMNASDSVLW